MNESFAEALQDTKKKKFFVEGPLQNVVKAAYPHVSSLEYAVVNGRETALIHLGESIELACIEADSLSTVINDVMRKLERY